MKLGFIKPLALSWEGWEKLDETNKSEHPLRYFIAETIPRKWRRLSHIVFHDWVWWVRHRAEPWHWYHIVKTGLPPGYYDTDTRILHTSFNLLREHVEINKDWLSGPEHEHSEEWQEARREMRDLHQWWTVGRPEKQDAAEKLWENATTQESRKDAYEREQELIKEDEQALIRLAKIRTGLWT